MEFRNLEEQVRKNQEDIKYILEEEGVLNQFGIKVVGQVTSEGELPEAATYEGEYGDAFAVGTVTPYTLYIYTRAFSGETSPFWFNIGQFPAPSTVPGPQGPQGDKGLPALQYKSTYNGTPATGQPLSFTKTGFSRDPVVGDVFLFKAQNQAESTILLCTAEITLVETLTANATVTSITGNLKGLQGSMGLTGAKGEKGDTGAQGPAGAQGPKGDPGPGFEVLG